MEHSYPALLTLEEWGALSGDAFGRLLDYCFAHSDCFTLTWQGSDCPETPEWNRRQGEFLAQLAPWLTGRISTSRWFWIRVSPKRPLAVFLYSTAPGAKQVLADTFHDLFLAAGEDCFWLPEDLCFFSQGRLWLGTASHEYHASAYPRSRGEAELLLSLGPWKERGRVDRLWTEPLVLADFPPEPQ